MMKTVSSLVAVAVLAVAGHAPGQAPAGAIASLEGEGLDFRRVVQTAKQEVFPAVVYIRCVRENTEEGKRASQQVSGSGVIISDAGEVLTNWHVVDDATAVRCLLSDGTALAAEVVGVDQDTDLALLQLEVPAGRTLPSAKIGRSATLAEGDFVMAMGAPYGLNRSVSIGIISCRRRFLPEVSEYSLWLQTDAAINPGNSGGPLVNTDGQVVGLNTRGLDMAQDMGFAIPAETIRQLLPRLRAHGEVDWSWIGLQLQPLRDFERDMYFDATDGVIVAATDPESPARRAGFAPRDRIVAVNGEAMTAMTAEDLPGIRRRLGLLPKHEPSIFTVKRGDSVQEIELVPRAKGEVEGEELVCDRWDLTVKTINQFDNPQLFFHRKQGVFVYGMKYPGNAAIAGLRPNDIILEIDGSPVQTLEEVKTIHRDALDNLDQRHRQVFVLLRGGLMRQVVVDYLREYDKE